MFTSIGSFTFHTYTLFLSLAILCSGGVAWFRLHTHMSARASADVFVAMVASGFVLARAEYALLNWDVFAGQPTRVFNMLTGGLDWHGAVLGALLGMGLVARVRRLDMSLLLEAYTPALPLVAFAGWTACRRVGCVYGVEVETLAFYPAWMVTEGRDIYGIIAPRYDTHTFGQALSWGLLVGLGALWLRGWQAPPGAALAVFCVGMAAIGTIRGDHAPVWAGVRADLWLDAAVFSVAVVMIMIARGKPYP
jgi:prolipoprotein diacylglyceryltransferase